MHERVLRSSKSLSCAINKNVESRKEKRKNFKVLENNSKIDQFSDYLHDVVFILNENHTQL